MQDQKCQEYLFDLDHFVLMKTKGQPEKQPNRTVYPELPADLMEMHHLNRDIHLSIDGSQCGESPSLATARHSFAYMRFLCVKASQGEHAFHGLA